MSAIPTSATENASGTTDAPRKRNRKPLSCNHCRIRKLKCSRIQPCEACVKSGDTETCSFTSIGPGPKPKNRTDLKNRVDQLETLLRTVVEKGIAQSPPSARSDSPSPRGQQSSRSQSNEPLRQSDELNNVSEELGVMKLSSNQQQSAYLGRNHWVSVFCQIQELKDYLHCNVSNWEENALDYMHAKSPGRGRLASFFGCFVPPISRETLLNSVPNTQTMDRLVDRYFAYFGSLYPVLHQPTFREEYAAFLDNATTTSSAWIAVLLAVMYAAKQSYFDLSEGPVPAQENLDSAAQDDYKVLIVQALVNSNFDFPDLNTLQALVIFLIGENVQSFDARMETSITLTMAIRLGMRMGFHREPRVHNLSPFLSEMRRRLWMVIHEMDIMTSFMLSLPSTIRQSDCTALLPRNLTDEDFATNTLILPQPRPLSELTTVSYSVARMRMLYILGRIMSFLDSGADLTPEQVALFDSQLHDARSAIPPALRVSLSPDATLIATALLKRRLSLDRVYHAANCMLHRKFLPLAHHNPQHVASRRKCIESALALLQHQNTLYADADPGFPKNPWKQTLSSVTQSDFYLAAIALALDLHFGFAHEPLTQSSSDIAIWGFDRRREFVAALETCISYYKLAADEVIEAAKAAGTLSYVVEKAKVAQRIVDAHARSQEHSPMPHNQPFSPAAVGLSLSTPQPPGSALGSDLFADMNGSQDVNKGMYAPTSMPGMPNADSFDFEWDLPEAPYAVDDETFDALFRWAPLDYQNGAQAPIPGSTGVI